MLLERIVCLDDAEVFIEYGDSRKKERDQIYFFPLE